MYSSAQHGPVVFQVDTGGAKHPHRHEAGTRGYGLYGQLVQKGFDCIVRAPSLIPNRRGKRCVAAIYGRSGSTGTR
ncbi:hypothetical protein [Paraburkholderia sp. SIMBA_054]|jgi:hypothetical protein|uniref:hypothetical protein n=1 Tax=Paraburkholderia TaxID=1822464 RepID=UPI0039789985